MAPFALDSGGLTETDAFGFGEFEFLLPVLVCLFCGFLGVDLGVVDEVGSRLSHGRTAIHRSTQLQPQLALASL